MPRHLDIEIRFRFASRCIEHAAIEDQSFEVSRTIQRARGEIGVVGRDVLPLGCVK